MGWWRWVAASVEAVLLLVLVLLWFDTLRERPGASRGSRTALAGAVLIPIGFVVVLLVPLWIGLILIAIPALAVATMALAS